MPKFQEDYRESHVPNQEHDFASLFVGNIYDCDNKSIWGFTHPDPSQKFHPGACIAYFPKRRESLLLKGTSQRPNSNYAHRYVQIEHEDPNVLDRATYFNIEPRHTVRDHRMRYLHEDHVRGELSEEDLQRLRMKSKEVFGWGEE